MATAILHNLKSLWNTSLNDSVSTVKSTTLVGFCMPACTFLSRIIFIFEVHVLGHLCFMNRESSSSRQNVALLGFKAWIPIIISQFGFKNGLFNSLSILSCTGRIYCLFVFSECPTNWDIVTCLWSFEHCLVFLFGAGSLSMVHCSAVFKTESFKVGFPESFKVGFKPVTMKMMLTSFN